MLQIQNNTSIIALFPFEFFAVFGIALGLIFFSYYAREKSTGRLANGYAILLLFLLIIVNHYNSQEIITLYQDSFIVDSFSKYGKTFLCILTIICLIVSENYLKRAKMTFEYTFILLMALLGLCLLLSAYDFLAIYLAIELQSLASYVLASMRRESASSVEAGLKYFILGSFASGLFVFGMSLIYALTGIHDLNHLGLYLSSMSLEDETSIIVIFGLLLMFGGLIFKIGGAPFHMWVADVYEGAPSSVTIFFMIVPKVALFGLFLRLCHFSFMDTSYIWVSFFVFSSILSLIFGSLGALSQVKIKRLFAFSSIDNVGYMLIGLASTGIEGENAIIIYLIIYSMGNLLFWSFLLSSYTFSSKKTLVTYITDLSGLAKINILLGVVLSVSLLSLAGIPPFAGFFAKMNIIRVSIDSDLYLLSYTAIFGSMISLFYYLRIVKIIFWDLKLYYSFTLKLYYFQLKKNVSYIISFLFFFLLWYITLDPAMETMCRSVTQCEESDTNDEISEDKKGEPEEKKFYQKKWFKYTVYALFALGGAALLTYGIILLYDHAAAKGLLPDYMKYAELYHMGVIYDNTSKYNADEQLASAQWVFNLEWLINDPELKFASIRSRAAELVLRYSMDIEVLKPVKDFLIDNNRCVLMKHVTDKVWHVAAYTHEYILNINKYAKENGWYTLDQFLLAKGIDRTRADWTVPGSEFSKFDMEDGS